MQLMPYHNINTRKLGVALPRPFGDWAIVGGM